MKPLSSLPTYYLYQFNKERSMAKETLQFNTEVEKILQLMIHSLYTNKDIFLRELISNASDACDKLRYSSQTDSSLLQGDSDLKVTITLNPEQNTLTISDNGIGMSRDELIENLGTIARSGTQHFVESLSGDSKKDMQLIGQFGVGFYSSFMVADTVNVISRKAGEDTAYSWSSQGTGEFTIEAIDGDIARGTSITLQLREDTKEYTDKHRIRHIATTYSDHIDLPIVLIDEEQKEETINTGLALWTRSKSDITDEQYTDFYHHVAHAGDDPWAVLHNKVEGTLQYTNLLFIPTVKPYDLFHPDRKCRLKLYIKRVFITEENIDLIPNYLRFVQGIVDSEDLPLNISRETLQHNALMHKIRKSLTKKILSELKKKANNDAESYMKFWNNFGAAVKEGLCDATEDRDAILEVCRFRTSKSDGKYISLDNYMERCKEGQKKIFYLTGNDPDNLMKSPQLEGFIEKDIEVLLLTDSVDDFWINVVHEYKDAQFMSITRSSVDLDNLGKEEEHDFSKTPEEQETQSAENKELETAHDALITFLKDALKDRVSDVKISHKLTNSPVCLGISDFGMDIRMERFLVEQKQIPAATAKILEINPQHPIVQTLEKYATSDAEAEQTQATEIASLLFDQACIIEGEPIKDVNAFASSMNRLLMLVA